MVEYIATKTGFMNGRRYRVGDTFFAEAGLKGHWFIVKGTEDQIHKPELEGSKEPTTLSEIARRGPAPAPYTSPGRRGPGRPKKDQD